MVDNKMVTLFNHFKIMEIDFPISNTHVFQASILSVVREIDLYNEKDCSISINTEDFHTHNNKKPKHAALYKSYMEDYGYLMTTCNVLHREQKEKRLNDKMEENERKHRQQMKI
uniref:Uncharacterized protein n=1 Tax=Romanomermis culicivorax TaxID=13658 RepID=A0A915J0D8_ROMCU